MPTSTPKDRRRSFEAFDLLREELRHCRSINADLLAALEDFTKAFVLRMGAMASGDARLEAADKMLWAKYEKARAAIAKAKGEA